MIREKYHNIQFQQEEATIWMKGMQAVMKEACADFGLDKWLRVHAEHVCEQLFLADVSFLGKQPFSYFDKGTYHLCPFTLFLRE